MKVILSLSIDYELVKRIDEKRVNKSRSQFICDTLNDSLQTTKKETIKGKK